MEPLIARLGYDVRQTLHHITGLLELMAEEPLSRNQSQYLSRCQTGADRLLRTANDLYLLANPRDTAGTPSAMVLRTKVAEIAELMQVLAGRKGLELTWAVEAEIPECVVADSEVIQDSLRRILDNAIRFTSNGSIALQVGVAGTPGDQAVLSFEVSDTGPGIPEEIQADIASSNRTPRSGGLGLAVVGTRIAAAGGSLSIPSNSPEGATVRFSLPVRLLAGKPAPSGDAPHTDLGSPASLPSGLRLLAAEDSDDSYLLLAAYLKGTGYCISRALNGAQAVEMAKSVQYDLIMMDANMPVMDGYEATRTIREWETVRGINHIPIVLISADDRLHQMRLGAAVGCSGYVAKPTTRARVLDAIHFFTADRSTAHQEEPSLETAR